MAKFMSVVMCEHGTVYVRLHGADEKIIAFGCMDKKIALEFTDNILEEIECGGTLLCESGPGGHA